MCARNPIFRFSIILIILSAIYVSVSSQNINAKWPYDDSIQFPYPTPDPINIIPAQAKFVPTPTPLTFAANIFQPAILKNTGTNILSITSGSSLATATGGILFNDTYNFFSCNFLWDLSLKSSSGVTVLGHGAPLQAVANFFNTKYGNLKNAMTKRDGIAQIVIQIAVGPITNPLFYPFQFAVKNIKKAGRSTLFLETFAYDWYYPPSLTHYYFAYPGIYRDYNTGKEYYSSTVMFVSRVPPPVISYEQFNATFGYVEDKAGNRYSNNKKIFPKGKRPLVVAKGVVYKPKI